MLPQTDPQLQHSCIHSTNEWDANEDNRKFGYQQKDFERSVNHMKAGWRWYGEKDAISLREIRQAGVTDVVAALYNRRPGEVWPVEEIQAMADEVKKAGMVWSVVESVPVHEDIKKRSGDWKVYVENYKQTLRNLAACDIKTVCYNFMPVLDWTRSNLSLMLPDGSDVLCYDHCEVAAFDMFSLKRPNAKRD
jgi:mannonate dehydratase